MSRTLNPLSRNVVDRVLSRATVTEVVPVTPRMRRIRLEPADMDRLSWQPGQQIRVLMDDPLSLNTLLGGLRDLLRTYSIFDLDRGSGWFDLCVLDHGDGPGSVWSRSVRPGEVVRFHGPEGRMVIQEAPYHLFIGEETASVAFAAMLRSLAADVPVHGVIEVATDDDRLDLPRGSELTWKLRGSAPATGSPSLLEAVKSLSLPKEPGMAYIAGEAKACAAVRRHLAEERGWPARQSIIVKPFWTPGKRGLD